MKNSLEKAELPIFQEFTPPEVSPATDEDIIAYLRYSCRMAEIAALAERNALILNACKQLDVTVSDEELQAAGDAFRLDHKLLGAAETIAWLSQQRIAVEDWSQGIIVKLLTKKLKEHLFGAYLDTHYLQNRHDYRRVALSQILLHDIADAQKVMRAIREEQASFCALSLEYSKGKQSRESGGFVGIRFVTELIPEIAEVIGEAKEGEVLEPIHTKLGYHIIKVEKWFPIELSESVREQILESLFQAWLQGKSNSNYKM